MDSCKCDIKFCNQLPKKITVDCILICVLCLYLAVTLVGLWYMINVSFPGHTRWLYPFWCIFVQVRRKFVYKIQVKLILYNY